ncbi:MAG: hypothetical protein HOO00_05065 [Rhodospirillaceae bacterium]|mgnify:CR=1 FL=1|jgi:hypothetical protein|nr:hypothetical protein [Rhodospirillaceae bacterium]MBT5374063.1 hypothetical protein [Rhodospirillaceae bacterium]
MGIQESLLNDAAKARHSAAEYDMREEEEGLEVKSASRLFKHIAKSSEAGLRGLGFDFKGKIYDSCLALMDGIGKIRKEGKGETAEALKKVLLNCSSAHDCACHDACEIRINKGL